MSAGELKDIARDWDVYNYRAHEADLSVPRQWQDQSMQMFRIPADAAGGADASFIITRDYQGVMAPRAYAEAQLSVLAQRFAGFRFISQNESIVRNRDVAAVDFEWTANEVLLRQRQAYLCAKECMLILTMTGRSNAFEHLDWTWNAVVGSLRLADAQRSDAD